MSQNTYYDLNNVVEVLLKYIKNKILPNLEKNKFNVVGVYLFGSRARQYSPDEARAAFVKRTAKPRKNADFDFIVLLDSTDDTEKLVYDEHIGFCQMEENKYACHAVVCTKVALLKEIENGIFDNAIRIIEGLEVFGRNNFLDCIGLAKKRLLASRNELIHFIKSLDVSDGLKKLIFQMHSNMHAFKCLANKPMVCMGRLTDFLVDFYIWSEYLLLSSIIKDPSDLTPEVIDLVLVSRTHFMQYSPLAQIELASCS